LKRTLKIGTRNSRLAVCQAELARQRLVRIGIASELEFIVSTGDLTQQMPLQIMEGSGMFTKSLDEAVIDGRVDIAVHSMKDMLPVLDDPLHLACVFEREDPIDVLVVRNEMRDIPGYRSMTIASGSLRRKAQWLYRFPGHRIVPIRGNVDSRLRQLENNDWDGTILAAAGLNRLNVTTKHLRLDWMIPAPSQGIIAVVTRKSDTELNESLSALSHPDTLTAARIEKEFLNYLGAGCSIPIGALAIAGRDEIWFWAEILDPDGKEKIGITLSRPVSQAPRMAGEAAEIAIKRGAGKMLHLNPAA
jgi:hydroxymethylbilane synthase